MANRQLHRGFKASFRVHEYPPAGGLCGTVWWQGGATTVWDTAPTVNKAQISVKQAGKPPKRASSPKARSVAAQPPCSAGWRASDVCGGASRAQSNRINTWFGAGKTSSESQGEACQTASFHLRAGGCGRGADRRGSMRETFGRTDGIDMARSQV